MILNNMSSNFLRIYLSNENFKVIEYKEIIKEKNKRKENKKK